MEFNLKIQKMFSHGYAALEMSRHLGWIHKFIKYLRDWQYQEVYPENTGEWEFAKRMIFFELIPGIHESIRHLLRQVLTATERLVTHELWRRGVSIR